MALIFSPDLDCARLGLGLRLRALFSALSANQYKTVGVPTRIDACSCHPVERRCVTGVGSSGRTERDDGRPECESTQGANGRKAQGRRRRRRRRGGAGGCAQLMCKHKGGERERGGEDQQREGPARQIEAQLGKHCVAPLGALAFKL